MSADIDAILAELSGAGWADALNDLPSEKLTSGKLQNLSLALEEYRARSIIVRSKPAFFVIEPTNHCNLHCSLCPTGHRDPAVPRGRMAIEQFKGIVDAISEHALVVNLLNWGEPLLHRDLPKFIAYADLRGLWSVVSSNFSLPITDAFLRDILESGLGVLHVNLDGTDPDTYAIFRQGGDFHRVTENLRRVVRMKRELGLKHPIIETSMIVSQYNEHQIQASFELSKQLGADRHKLSKLQIDPNSSFDWLPRDRQHAYRNYFDDDSAESLCPCSRLYTFMVVNWNGNVAACCLTYDERSDLGNCLSVSPDKVWNNENFQTARGVFSIDPDDRPSARTICHICRNRLGSKLLSHYRGTFALALPGLEDRLDDPATKE
ncbi:putative Radical SAM domain protein [Syntrophobacter sp. SbD1]|nr:putative Radical SAM domain protein [Syntrophobacter sp. SbD1]